MGRYICAVLRSIRDIEISVFSTAKQEFVELTFKFIRFEWFWQLEQHQQVLNKLDIAIFSVYPNININHSRNIDVKYLFKVTCVFPTISVLETHAMPKRKWRASKYYFVRGSRVLRVLVSNFKSGIWIYHHAGAHDIWIYSCVDSIYVRQHITIRRVQQSKICHK